MKAQAKKMNVDSLKSNQKDGEASAEVKIAKVAITNVMLWLCTWTPYAVVVAIPVFGNPMLVTPIVSQLPAFLGKLTQIVSGCLQRSSWSKIPQIWMIENVPDKVFHFFCAAKTSSCINPIVFAVSHPKFREAMAKEIPCMGIGQYSNSRTMKAELSLYSKVRKQKILELVKLLLSRQKLAKHVLIEHSADIIHLSIQRTAYSMTKVITALGVLHLV